MRAKGDAAKTSMFWHLWRWPVVLGVLSTSGLLTALVSDGWGDWWAWLGLGIPVVVMAWFACARAKPQAGRQV